MSCKVRYFDLEVSAYNKTKIDKSIKTCIARIFLISGQTAAQMVD